MVFTWGFKCMFNLGIYYCRLKVLYCVVDAIVANKLCSMNLIHLFYACCCSIVPFTTYCNTPNEYVAYIMNATL